MGATPLAKTFQLLSVKPVQINKRLDWLDLRGAQILYPRAIGDRFVAMCEENVIPYVRPQLCASRAQEILSAKQSQSFSMLADANLKVKKHDADLECGVTGEMTREAFHRRALGMDLAQMGQRTRVWFLRPEEWLEWVEHQNQAQWWPQHQ